MDLSVINLRYYEGYLLEEYIEKEANIWLAQSYTTTLKSFNKLYPLSRQI